MKLFFIVFLMGPLSWGTVRTSKLTPYQVSLQKCLGSTVDLQKTDNHRKLYSALEASYSLVSSELLYREVVYKQRNELKKLKYENDSITVYDVDEEDGGLKLISTEKVGEENKTNELRHKPLSAEARIRQLLIRADIRTDFTRVRERRSGGLVVNISWADQQIRSLKVDFSESKKSLNCTQKESVDICTCAG